MAQHDLARVTELGSMVEAISFHQRHEGTKSWKLLIEDLSIAA